MVVSILSPSELPDPLSAAFLGPEATQTQLLGATAANHRDCFFRGSGPAVLHQAPGLSWAYTPHDGFVTLAFPRLSRSSANEILDATLAACRRLQPSRIVCWSLEPTRPSDLGARLAARGFEWGWKPHWMALDLDRMQADSPVPADVTFTVHDGQPEWEVDDLPYYSRPQRPAAPFAPSDRRWQFGAWQGGQIVGQSVLHLTTGRLGVAGIYNVGVVPAARNQGIGRAVSLAACQFARALGCRWATLNAATHIYEKLGFVSLGWGQTWFLHTPMLAAPPPTPSQVAFAEAVGRGDLKMLDTLAASGRLPVDLDAPFPNGMTAMEMAIRPGKIASVEWLMKHGATLEIVHALDLGWKDRLPALLAADPALVNRRVGPWGTTALHKSVERGDMELACLLLTASADLSLKDTQFGSTALGWAHHFGRSEIVALLESFDGKPSA